MKVTSKHVVSRDKGWAVKTSGTSRAGKVFESKAEAVEYARRVARKEHGELYVHGLDGTIQERKSYRRESEATKSLRSKK
ncbi:DUF2188 domain-containing protein [Halomonas sp. DP1Y21-3]|uniref:DUF2188 domain-containing protein n=1 Tax=Halomonas sp. DP1Y21-3 TaxID=2859080 RepID=UPI001BCE1C4B|nr:DUF2188 domain-containing protein [Halomonas sp. DP1Y21-3]MBS8269845.1 DUF2188 domain-containing protein [Halomonas litopenaei]MBY6111596.1 DUF2188 domain-containing protein [Halomonas sp. DP1Y21-3]